MALHDVALTIDRIKKKVVLVIFEFKFCQNDAVIWRRCSEYLERGRDGVRLVLVELFLALFARANRGVDIR